MSRRPVVFRDPLPDVVTWRAQRLRRAGFDRESSEAAAADTRLDLHAMLELVERGCPPELALRIVALLE